MQETLELPGLQEHGWCLRMRMILCIRDVGKEWLKLCRPVRQIYVFLAIKAEETAARSVIRQKSAKKAALSGQGYGCFRHLPDTCRSGQSFFADIRFWHQVFYSNRNFIWQRTVILLFNIRPFAGLQPFSRISSMTIISIRFLWCILLIRRR